MTEAQRMRAIRLSDQGFRATAIAAMLDLPNAEVRSALAEYWRRNVVKKHKTFEQQLADAKALMLKAGYDPAVVKANFG